MNDEAARTVKKYHESTKYALYSMQSDQHTLDWNNEPRKFKIYRDVETISLPVDLPEAGMPAMEALVYRSDVEGRDVMPGLEQLAYLLYYTGGITKKLEADHYEFYFRAAPCAGALYPIEVYLVCGDLPGLPAGVYHFNPASFGLDRLRSKDWRAVLALAGGNDESLYHAPAVLVFTAITWRSSWKYRDRAYRYHFWDAGAMAANSLAAAVAQELPHKVILGFVDETVNRLIGVDGIEEKVLCLLPVGWTARPAPASPEDLTEIEPRVEPLSERQMAYPLIDEVHAASNLDSPDVVAAWRGSRSPLRQTELNGDFISLAPRDLNELPDVGLEEVILRRGSSRRFLHEPVSFSDLSSLLSRAASYFPAGWLSSQDDLLNDLFFTAHAVDGLSPGAYVYHRQQGTVELLKEGSFRARSAHACLGQNLGGDSSFTVYFLANLRAILDRYGARGYRLAQMEAGILGGRLYLGAYALCYGATGLTFFDEEVLKIFGPKANGLEAIFVVALGVPGKASRLERRGRRLRYLPPGVLLPYSQRYS